MVSLTIDQITAASRKQIAEENKNPNRHFQEIQKNESHQSWQKR